MCFKVSQQISLYNAYELFKIKFMMFWYYCVFQIMIFCSKSSNSWCSFIKANNYSIFESFFTDRFFYIEWCKLKFSTIKCWSSSVLSFSKWSSKFRVSVMSFLIISLYRLWICKHFNCLCFRYYSFKVIKSHKYFITVQWAWFRHIFIKKHICADFSVVTE